MPDIETQNKALIQNTIAELNKGNTAILAQVTAADYAYYSPSNAATALSSQDMIAQFDAVRAAFPDIQWHIEAMYADGDSVITRFVISGTHQAEYMGIPATGAKIEYSSIVIVGIKDGKIIEEREEANLLGVMQQLGMELQPKGQ